MKQSTTKLGVCIDPKQTRKAATAKRVAKFRKAGKESGLVRFRPEIKVMSLKVLTLAAPDYGLTVPELIEWMVDLYSSTEELMDHGVAYGTDERVDWWLPNHTVEWLNGFGSLNAGEVIDLMVGEMVQPKWLSDSDSPIGSYGELIVGMETPLTGHFLRRCSRVQMAVHGTGHEPSAIWPGWRETKANWLKADANERELRAGLSVRVRPIGKVSCDLGHLKDIHPERAQPELDDLIAQMLDCEQAIEERLDKDLAVEASAWRLEQEHERRVRAWRKEAART